MLATPTVVSSFSVTFPHSNADDLSCE